MKILLDENLDWRLGRELSGHEVDSVPKIGWAGVKNGELLRRANSAYDLLITMDKGIYHQ
jgi:predicted nuclease of predicted toxin-antitoxin system